MSYQGIGATRALRLGCATAGARKERMFTEGAPDGANRPLAKRGSPVSY